MITVKNENRRRDFPLLVVALLTVMACSTDTVPQPANDGSIALQVTSNIESRAHSNMWESGDAIGVYMLNGTTVDAANKKYTTSSITTIGTFNPVARNAIYFPANGAPRDFVAYYPYTLLEADNLYPVDVTTQTPQKAIDLMAAVKVIGKHKDDASVAFTFTHKLVKLDITLKGDDVSITDAQLTGTMVKITNQQTTGFYSVVGDRAVGVTQGTAMDITLHTTGLKTEGIVLPNATTEGMALAFTVPGLDNTTFTWEIKKAAQLAKFEAGKRYTYTITIGKTGLNVTSAITDWESGNGTGEEGEVE